MLVTLLFVTLVSATSPLTLSPQSSCRACTAHSLCESFEHEQYYGATFSFDATVSIATGQTPPAITPYYCSAESVTTSGTRTALLLSKANFDLYWDNKPYSSLLKTTDPCVNKYYFGSTAATIVASDYRFRAECLNAADLRGDAACGHRSLYRCCPKLSTTVASIITIPSGETTYKYFAFPVTTTTCSVDIAMQTQESYFDVYLTSGTDMQRSILLTELPASPEFATSSPCIKETISIKRANPGLVMKCKTGPCSLSVSLRCVNTLVNELANVCASGCISFSVSAGSKDTLVLTIRPFTPKSCTVSAKITSGTGQFNLILRSESGDKVFGSGPDGTIGPWDWTMYTHEFTSASTPFNPVLELFCDNTFGKALCSGVWNVRCSPLTEAITPPPLTSQPYVRPPPPPSAPPGPACNAAYCSYHGTATKSTYDDCDCQCTAGYTGLQCNACAEDYISSGSSCLACSNSVHCNGKAISISSNDARTRCECRCSALYEGLQCGVCAESRTHYPSCDVCGGSSCPSNNIGDTTRSTEKPKTQGLSDDAIAGIVVGVVMGVAAIAGGFATAWYFKGP